MLMRFIILFFFLSLSTTVLAQSVDNPIRPGFIALYVHNIDSMVSWYETKLGFKTLKLQKANNTLAFAMLEWQGIWIEMIQNPKVTSKVNIRETFHANDVEGCFKLGFHCKNLEALYIRLQQKQVKITYPLLYNKHFEMNLFIAEDPEGNWIQFYNTPLQK